MKIKKPPSYMDLLEELNDLHGEYIEMGIPLDHFLLPKLFREREKNHELMMKIDYLERKLHENI